MSQGPPDALIAGNRDADACVEADVLASFVDGLLSPDDRLMVEKHLATCEICRSLVANAAMMKDSTAG